MARSPLTPTSRASYERLAYQYKYRMKSRQISILQLRCGKPTNSLRNGGVLNRVLRSHSRCTDLSLRKFSIDYLNRKPGLWQLSVGLVVFAALSALCSTAATADESPAANTLEYYQSKVQPILKAACYECHSHSSGEASGRLVVDSRRGLIEGGTRGPSIAAGSPESSLLIKAIGYSDPDLQMPPAGPLPSEQQQILTAWIAAGAIAPESSGVTSTGKSTVPDPRTHWAYQPIRLNSSPTSANVSESLTSSPLSAIDRILKKQLAERNLTMSPRADRATVLRRLHYDLTGLPPSWTELARLLDDPRPDQVIIQESIEQLLASPRFGERWARFWMDVARYADTKGYVFQEDRQYPEAYRYRDWLIDAFNADLPYPDFVRKQIAADLEPHPDADLPALGFLTLGRRFLNNKHDIIDDRLDVITRGLMGMTLQCSRCHDHKYDPISQVDYYGMYGILLNTDEPGGAPFAHRLSEATEPRTAHVLLRGNPGNRGDAVPRRFVGFLSPKGEANLPEGGSGRASLADRIVSPENPLTARVFVNRVWLRLMGTSITESPSDFGTRCPPPLQQELLDQMAIEFIRSGWSMKSVVRSILSSEAYQQQSLARPAAENVDPANTLYWRANRRRRDLESLRDALLAAANELDNTLYGKSEKIHEAPFSHRRTVYAYIDRQNLPGIFRNFDLASPDSHSPMRPFTSVPQQGLYLLNSDFVAELAMQLGKRAEERAGSQAIQSAISELVLAVLQRLPTGEEITEFQAFINLPLNTTAEASSLKKPRMSRWQQLAHALLASNEFAFID